MRWSGAMINIVQAHKIVRERGMSFRKDSLIKDENDGTAQSEVSLFSICTFSDNESEWFVAKPTYYMTYKWVIETSLKTQWFIYV